MRRSLLTYAHGITTVSMKKVTVQLSEKGNQEKHPASGVGGGEKMGKTTRHGTATQAEHTNLRGLNCHHNPWCGLRFPHLRTTWSGEFKKRNSTGRNCPGSKPEAGAQPDSSSCNVDNLHTVPFLRGLDHPVFLRSTFTLIAQIEMGGLFAHAISAARLPIPRYRGKATEAGYR